MLVMLFEGGSIHYLNFMFNESSFIHVQVTVGKQAFPFEQQISGLFGSLPEALGVHDLQDLSLLGIAIRPL